MKTVPPHLAELALVAPLKSGLEKILRVKSVLLKSAVNLQLINANLERSVPEILTSVKSILNSLLAKSSRTSALVREGDSSSSVIWS